MTAPFSQTIQIYGFDWNNTVDYFYDSTTQPVGSSIYVHSQGQHDELCTSVLGFEFSDEPCSLIARTDGWRYIFFPTASPAVCCRACNVTDYCGIIAPWWLQENSTYQGQQVVDGVLANGWLKVGGEQNYAWFLASDNSTAPQPVR